MVRRGDRGVIFGQVTSYSKARGESLGIPVHGGLAGRADRLFLGLLGALLTGLGIAWALPAAVATLCIAGAITVGQRMFIVHRAIQQGPSRASRSPDELTGLCTNPAAPDEGPPPSRR